MAVYTLWSQTGTGGANGSDPNPYTIGTQFSVNTPGCTLTAIWWYSPTWETVLPQTIALYQVSGTSLVTSQSASWSGAAGSGWVRATFTSPPSLTSGTAYKACILQNTASNFYSFTSNYWSSGAGSAGITNGPLTAPNTSGASPSQCSFNAGSALAYPGTSSATANNYWVDPEVTQAAAVVPSGGSAAFAPGWHPGAGLPGMPGGIPFAWAQTVAPGAVPPPPAVIPATAGVYSGIPGKAIPGLFIPGNPGAQVTPLQQTAAAAYAPGWHPGTGLPGMPGGIPFTAVPQGFAQAQAAAAPASGPPVYPLGRPVQARRLPQRGGSTSSRRGVFAQAGPPVKPADGPVRAQPAVPFLKGRASSRSGLFGGTGPAVKPQQSPVAAKGRGLPPRGRTSFRTGTFAQAGAPVTPPHGPVQAKRLPQRGGSVTSRAGTFTSVTPGAGPPVYPLGRPVQAKRLPARGGSTSARRGPFAQQGPPVKPPQVPVQARQPLPPRGTAQSRAGVFTFVATGSGPPVVPWRAPVRTRPQPPPRGRIVRSAGTFAQSGPPVVVQRQPVSAARRPLPSRGRTASQRGPYAQAGPPVVRARKPARGQPQKPVLTGRAAWRPGTYTPPPPITLGYGAILAGAVASGDPGTGAVASGDPGTGQAATGRASQASGGYAG